DDRSTPTPPPAPPGRGRPSLGKPAGAGRGRPGRAGGCHPGGRRARESHRSGEVGSILERRCFRGLPCPERGRCCPAASGRGRPGQGAGPDPFPAPCPTAGRTAAGILPLGSFGGAPRRPGPPARVPPPPSGLGPGDRPPSPPLSGPAAGCSGKAPGGFRWIGGRPVRPLPAEGDDVRETALRAFRAFRGALRAEGLDCRDVLLVYLYVRDVDRFSAVDSAYAAVFDGRPPARVCVEAPLASGGAAADGRPGPGAARPGRSCGCGASRTGRPPASRPLQPERRGGRAGVLLRADRAPALHHAAGGRRRRSRGPRRPGPRPENPGRLAAGPPAPPRAVCPLLRHPQRLRPGRAGRLARRHRGTRPGTGCPPPPLRGRAQCREGGERRGSGEGRAAGFGGWRGAGTEEAGDGDGVLPAAPPRPPPGAPLSGPPGAPTSVSVFQEEEPSAPGDGGASPPASAVVTVLVVPRLPRGAAVEWHVVAVADEPGRRRHRRWRRATRDWRVECRATEAGEASGVLAALSPCRPPPPGRRADPAEAADLLGEVVLRAAGWCSEAGGAPPLAVRGFYRQGGVDPEVLFTGEAARGGRGPGAGRGGAGGERGRAIDPKAPPPPHTHLVPLRTRRGVRPRGPVEGARGREPGATESSPGSATDLLGVLGQVI
uniref:Uncharacterized protein n=1 Tax=Ornithorhynchus anatinus TaxID=9258 RepID=A0A6I8PEM6_ORNAN